MFSTERYRCPYDGCGYEGTEAQVDDHRATGVHNDQPQAGSNIRASGTARSSYGDPSDRPTGPARRRLRTMDASTPAGTRQCPHCNGYGSSFHEAADRCTRCNGTGLVPADSEPGRADGQEPGERST